jgi:hypothetical protein
MTEEQIKQLVGHYVGTVNPFPAVCFVKAVQVANLTASVSFLMKMDTNKFIVDFQNSSTHNESHLNDIFHKLTKMFFPEAEFLQEQFVVNILLEIMNMLHTTDTMKK